MRKITDWLLGFCRITVTGASPAWCLNRLTKAAVPFWNIRWKDEFCVSVSVCRRDLAAATDIAVSAMCQVEEVREHGLPGCMKKLKRRICLLFLLLFSVAAAIVVPRFVWFYEVEGNTSVPSEKIIRAAQDCGVKVGTYGKNIKPLLVKDMVLSEIPELSWLTVTQSGGRAAIVVREKRLPEPVVDRRTPKNVVASRPGLITDLSVLEGSAAVKRGDIVTEGQLLISGCMDLEYKYRLCGAKGEVYARTWRETEAVTPQKCAAKCYTGKEKNIFSLCFGRKRIKLSLGSGILPAGCDKMTREYVFTLPGGLTLPIALVKETCRFYDSTETAVSDSYAKKLIEEAAAADAMRDMCAGVIRDVRTEFAQVGDNYKMKVTLECEEMISHTVEAEIFKGEMQHDGTSD